MFLKCFTERFPKDVLVSVKHQLHHPPLQLNDFNQLHVDSCRLSKIEGMGTDTYNACHIIEFSALDQNHIEMGIIRATQFETAFV